MKKFILFAASVALLASCANDTIIDNGGKTEKNAPISFQISQKNMTRADKTLQSTGHYNFGVWSYKDTDPANAVMNNYLVGYMDATGKKGYYMTAANQTTLGDATSETNGTSMWAYEKMGSGQGQYSWTTNGDGENYYLSSDNTYKSNNTEQWLKYWDLSSASTEFFAYAPYINSATATTPTFVNSTKKMTFADNSIIAGFDDLSLYEYMYAYTKIAKADYKKDVPLAFKRMNSKINIKFWEDIDGYKVEIVNLQGNTTGATVDGVQATPSVRSGEGTTASPFTYALSSTFWTKGKADVQFPYGTVTEPTCAITGTYQDGKNLVFRIPEFASTDKSIGTTRDAATPSPSTYYGLPLGTENATGFNFHVSYKLISEDTGETIYVNNATVYVPAANVQWAPNTHYTYIFKITKNSSGTTDKSDTPNYVDPAPDPTPSLYPIVFDNCTVEDWIEKDPTDHIIN